MSEYKRVVPLSEQLGGQWGIPGEWIEPHLAAAEERGRRRAETEQADLLLACEEALIWCSAADAFKPDGIAALGWQRVVLPVLERVRITRKPLAPRDSGQEDRK